MLYKDPFIEPKIWFKFKTIATLKMNIPVLRVFVGLKLCITFPSAEAKRRHKRFKRHFVLGLWNKKCLNCKLYLIKHHNSVPLSVLLIHSQYQWKLWNVQRGLFRKRNETQLMLYQSYSTGLLTTYEIIPVGSFWRRGRGETVASIHGKTSWRIYKWTENRFSD